MSDVLLWVDIETTGLNEHRDRIIEIGMFATSMDGNILLEPYAVSVRPRWWAVRRRMLRQPVQGMHADNRLLDELDSPLCSTPKATFARLRLYVEACCSMGRVLLAGSSVHFDRRFLDAQYPGLLSGLSHRILDVSVLDEVARHERPDVWQARPSRTTNHRVLACLHDSIALYAYYVDHLIVKGE